LKCLPFKNCFFRYCVNPGLVSTGLGMHIIPGLGCFGSLLAGIFWLPWLTSPEHGIQTVIYCATEENLSEQSGFYYSDCAVQLTSENGSNMDDAYRLWELSERMAGLTSWSQIKRFFIYHSNINQLSSLIFKTQLYLCVFRLKIHTMAK